MEQLLAEMHDFQNMRSSEPTSSQARKPAKRQAPGAVDFICLLSKDGDVFPESTVRQHTYSAAVDGVETSDWVLQVSPVSFCG